VDPKPIKPASTGSGKNKVTSSSGSGKIAAAPASGSGKSPVAAPSESAAAAAPAAGAAAAPVVNPKAGMYGLIAVVIGGTMIALLFLQWLQLKAHGKGGSYYSLTGLNIMLQQFDESGENAKDFVAQMKDPEKLMLVGIAPDSGIKPDEIIRARQLNATWVPILLYAYAGLVGLTTLVGLLNAGKVAPPALGGRLFGVLMTITGIVAMATIAITLFVENKLPAELGSTMTGMFKYVWHPFGVIGAGLGFCFFGLGLVYFLTGTAPSGGKGKPKPRPRIGASSGPVSFEPPM
jgi:hypothetical protein